MWGVMDSVAPGSCVNSCATLGQGIEFQHLPEELRLQVAEGRERIEGNATATMMNPLQEE